MTTLDRPRQIIEFCLKPLRLNPSSPDHRETNARLEHVINTYQLEIMKAKAPVAVDFFRMPSLTINEAAHGHE